MVCGDRVSPSGSDLDFFLARLGAGGNLRWERSSGTGQNERWWSVAADGAGGA